MSNIPTIDLPQPSAAPEGSRITIRHSGGAIRIYSDRTGPLVLEPDMRATFERQERANDDCGGFAPRRVAVWVLVRLVRIKRVPGAPCEKKGTP